ncbi:MAG: carboxylate-amine ligase [Bacteroidetes bacterium]|nr:carboxylate-amine ligase [Bacteroidota bacterium]
MSGTFPQRPDFTLGIEEEFMIVDRQTGDLKSSISEIFEDGRMILQEKIKPEMHMSVVEVGTHICKTTAEARQEILTLRSEIAKLAKKQGLEIAASGTHPFSHWKDQEIHPDIRYLKIVEDMQIIARSNLIFGLHVHVGISDKQTAIEIMNEVRYFLPHILALSSNSPFWIGRKTGLMSYRTKVFDKFPRTGIPDYFPTHFDFSNYIDTLIKVNSIDNAKKIWWDVRPHPFFPTLEFRIADVQMRVDETIALAALIQSICLTLWKMRTKNTGWRLYRRDLIMENKWRAARYGIRGNMIDFGKNMEVPTIELLYELIELVADSADELGCRRDLMYIHKMISNGTGAERQIRVFEDSGGNFEKLVSYIVDETHLGLDLGAGA